MQSSFIMYSCSLLPNTVATNSFFLFKLSALHNLCIAYPDQSVSNTVPCRVCLPSQLCSAKVHRAWHNGTTASETERDALSQISICCPERRSSLKISLSSRFSIHLLALAVRTCEPKSKEERQAWPFMCIINIISDHPAHSFLNYNCISFRLCNSQSNCFICLFINLL